jgi:hypothetical protein
MIATIATVILCGCPGLFVCLFGAMSAAGLGTFDLNGQGGGIPPAVGITLVCVSLIMILIPVGVGFFTLRKKPAAITTVSDEPLPPAS